jgi:class 3 adenylate cyclase
MIVGLVYAKGFKFYDTAFELALGYFNERYRPSYSRLRKILEKGDVTALLWVSLVYGISGGHLGEDRGNPKELVRDLNTHSDAKVSEYSIWGLFRSDVGGFSDIAIPPQSILSFPPNVRRWYYRMLTKVPETLDANFDLMEEAIRTESSSEAREGLAIGLATLEPDSGIARLMLDWYGRERNTLVRAKLLEHFARFHSYQSDYRDVIAKDQDLGPYERRLMAIAVSPREPLTVELQSKHKTRTEEEERMSIAIIGRESVRTSYILAVDTVDFSRESDTIQLSLFRDLLQDFGTDRSLHGVRQEDLITLLTGDGLIVVAGGEDNRLLPLRLALSILERYERTRGKKIRCGVNSGPTHWIEMSDVTRQVIGHAVNWAARVMAAAGGNEVLISDNYYKEIAQPARSELRGIKFEVVEGLHTKKDEPIPAWRASYTS